MTIFSIRKENLQENYTCRIALKNSNSAEEKQEHGNEELNNEN